MARDHGLKALAFADHNSVDNVAEGLRLADEFAIEFIPCLELNTFQNDLDLHLLAYYVDSVNPELQDWMEEIRRKKVEQAEGRLVKLNELGFRFTWDDLKRFSGWRIPTGMSYLRAILSRSENLADPRLKPYISGERSRSPYVNFYRDYLRGGKPAFVPMKEISTIEAISRIKGMDAIPILAHPSDTRRETILQLIAAGLEGLEAYSSYHSPEEQEAFRVLAEEHGLLVTAGSDFHGASVKPDVTFGQVLGHLDLLHKLKSHRKGKT